MPPTTPDLARRASEVIAHLAQVDLWAPSLTSASIEDRSYLVEALASAPDEAHTYRIFSMRVGSRITGRLLLDEQTALLLEVEGIQRTGAQLPPFVEPLHALAQLHPLAVAAASAGSPPRMVWKYSAESTSRFRPFWLVQANQQTFYIRVDGAVFTTLTNVDR